MAGVMERGVGRGKLTELKSAYYVDVLGARPGRVESQKFVKVHSGVKTNA